MGVMMLREGSEERCDRLAINIAERGSILKGLDCSAPSRAPARQDDATCTHRLGK
jgi:hypothetical protein